MSAVSPQQVVCNVCRHRADRVRELRWEKDGYAILRCRSCKTLFRADLPTSAELIDIYGPAYFSDKSATTAGEGYANYLGEEANHRANAAARLRLLECHRPAGRLLDVGCAAGFFLDEARQRGWHVEGVELAAEMASYARDQLDLAVAAVPFAEIRFEREAFDAITMWDYLEHSSDPAGDLRRAARLLRPGGVIAISTGDAGSLAARIFRRRWHLLTPRHHNFFFTRASLERALGDAGFEVVSAKYASSRYSMYYLVHKLRTLTRLSILSALARTISRGRVGTISVPVNLFDIVTVLGRRI